LRCEDTSDFDAVLLTQFLWGEANAALEESVQVLQPVHLNQVAQRILKGKAQRQGFGPVPPFLISLWPAGIVMCASDGRGRILPVFTELRRFRDDRDRHPKASAAL
jgi:hypothetical protein